LALLRRARSLRRFAFAIRRESVARSRTGLTLADPTGGWAFHDIVLLTSFFARWRGTKTGAPAVLMRGSHIHGRGLDDPVLAVAIDKGGLVVRTAPLLPGRFLRLGAATWVLELPAGAPKPVPGTTLAIYARPSERQADPVRNPYRQSW
jgi:hypothetical protein